MTCPKSRSVAASAPALSDIFLSDLGPGTGLAMLGFRAAAFGKEECCCVASGFRSALGTDAAAGREAVGRFAKRLGKTGRRRIGLSAPGCGRMTRDEVSIACALAAGQAWDREALDAHLSWLLAAPVPQEMMQSTEDVADIFAAHGLVFEAPARASAVPQGLGLTPAFSLVRGGAR